MTLDKKKLTKQQKADWEIFAQQVFGATETFTETADQKAARLESFKTDYNAFFRYYFPHYAETDCAEYHIEIATNLRDNPIINQFNIIYRGGAKSVHSNLGVPMWLIFIFDQINFMLLVGENFDKGKLLLMDLQVELQYNQRLIADFGVQMQYGDWSDGEFKIQKGSLFKAIGINQSARGLRNLQSRPDYVSVDDVEDRKKAENEQIVAERVDKITSDIMGAFSKDRQRLVISNNLIHKSGVIAGLLEKLGNKSRTRITSRAATDENGNPTWPERFTREYWQEKEKDTPAGSWEREWKNNPVEEGKLFKSEWFQWKDMPLETLPTKKIVVYGDLSYKATGDYKALIAGFKFKDQYWIYDAFVRKTTLADVIDWCYDFRASIPEYIMVEFWFEASFMQDMFLDDFNAEAIKRKQTLNVRGDKRAKPDKFMRIEAMTTTYQKLKVFYNQELKGSKDADNLIDKQFLLFEKGSSAHDDGPDATEGLIHILSHQAKIGSFPNSFISKIRKNSW
ncbi:hypothetical protein QNI19_14590 [Cytophagaceae bacterium DM2B3-1]|uniref:Terminase n=1 Tax=Xanthocytophaga flava TaxID=3048013 RepID=A0ABT7CKA6_9BACT|nr:hypothetical protein [Xanthocytophaga flavus]MDJ1494168.1 hypothetical protein [Xanthocytophaga flavus]